MISVITGIEEIVTHEWRNLDYAFLCLWEDASLTWKYADDIVAGNSDAIIQDYLLKLQDKDDWLTFETIFDLS